MRAEFAPSANQSDGLMGPELIVNTVSGESCLRFADGTLSEQLPSAPRTNAFMVWVGFHVLVISDGVSARHLSGVAQALRQALQTRDLPVVARQGRFDSAGGSRSISEGAGAHATRELARAEAYALVQAAWEEDAIVVDLDGQRFEFQSEFRLNPAGTVTPVIGPMTDQFRTTLRANAPSHWTVEQFISWDWHDGPREGVCQFRVPDCTVYFRVIADLVIGSKFYDQLFLFRPLQPDAVTKVLAIFGHTNAPTTPGWAPHGPYESEEARTRVEAAIESIVRTAGDSTLIVRSAYLETFSEIWLPTGDQFVR